MFVMQGPQTCGRENGESSLCCICIGCLVVAVTFCIPAGSYIVTLKYLGCTLTFMSLHLIFFSLQNLLFKLINLVNSMGIGCEQ